MAVNGFTNIVTDGLVLSLDAGNLKSYPTTGTTWTDLTKNGGNGVLTNSPVFNPSNSGVIIFDGIDDFANLGSVPKLQFTNTQPFSLCTWIYWTPLVSTVSTLLSYGIVQGASPNVGDRGYYIAVDNGVLRDKSFLFDYYDGFSFRGIQGNANTLLTNSWMYLVGTSDNTNTAAGLKFYINGIQTTSYTVRGDTSPTSINYTNCNVNIFARDSKVITKGNSSQTQIYNRVLSPSEVLQNYNATKWRFI